ncbi:hypothetical protein PFISCL1PPCAC_19316, partial [Pristionchus fissidentatus]
FVSQFQEDTSVIRIPGYSEENSDEREEDSEGTEDDSDDSEDTEEVLSHTSLHNLPKVVLWNIYSYLPIEDRMRTRRVCKHTAEVESEDNYKVDELSILEGIPRRLRNYEDIELDVQKIIIRSRTRRDKYSEGLRRIMHNTKFKTIKVSFQSNTPLFHSLLNIISEFETENIMLDYVHRHVFTDELLWKLSCNAANVDIDPIDYGSPMPLPSLTIEGLWRIYHAMKEDSIPLKDLTVYISDSAICYQLADKLPEGQFEEFKYFERGHIPAANLSQIHFFEGRMRMIFNERIYKDEGGSLKFTKFKNDEDVEKEKKD